MKDDLGFVSGASSASDGHSELIARLEKATADFDRRMNEIGGCSDGYCQITGKAKGMHTNGGCRCAHQKYTAQRALANARTFRNEVESALKSRALNKGESE